MRTVSSIYFPPEKEMADYWKSNPRRFCEVCKCWFGDNRASIDFHERGKRHQESVMKLLSSARQKTANNEKKAEETARMLASIETAALTAYEKDLEKQHGGLPISQQAKLSSTSQDSQLQILDDKKAKAHLEILQTIQNHQQKMEAKSQDGPPPPPPPSLWQQATTPDGHVYYYNVFTRETQWEEPENFQPLVQPTPPSSTAQETPCKQGGDDGDSPGASRGGEQAGKKRVVEERGQLEGEESGPPAAKRRPQGPYGAWTTIAVCPQQPAEEEEEGKKDEELSEDSDGDGGSDGEEGERGRFGERTVSSLPAPGEEAEEGGAVMPGSFRGFGFKKRAAGAAGGGRPQIRQRTSDLS